MHAIAADRIDTLLARIQVSANLIHSGPLCGVTEEPAIPGTGYLHVVQKGLASVRQAGHPTLHVVEPTLLFYARPLAHHFMTDGQSSAEFVCATVAFDAGHLDPIMQSLPPLLAVPLREAPELHTTLALLFAETFGEGHARQATANRLFEVLLIQLLRRIIEQGALSPGTLAGLGHPRIGDVLLAIHDAPGAGWTLATLAAKVDMSRSAFAALFKRVVGATAGDYLCAHRLSLAQEQLRLGHPLKNVARAVGYGSALALSRAFKARLGQTPHDWLKSTFSARYGPSAPWRDTA